MVKPQLNLDRKDDLKKPDSNLVKVVTIPEEPAPLNPEPIYAPPIRVKKGRRVCCLCTSLIGIFFILVAIVCVFGFFFPRLAYRHGNYGLWCGVDYTDDWDYYYNDVAYTWQSSLTDYDSWYEGGKRPFGDDILFPPRPTGPPMRRFLEEHLDINVELGIVRINRGQEGAFPEVNVLHDFNMNISAYMIPSSDVCYIRPLDRLSTLTPEQFNDLLETEAFRDQDFPMRSELYTVNPEQMTYAGEHIEEMCSEYSSYYINQIPTGQWPSFWKTAREVLRDHFGRSDSDSDSSDEAERDHRGRHGGGRRRHGGRGRHGDSSSEEEGSRRERRFTRMGEHFDNVRSFDGQQVLDTHVFKAHNLDGLSSENLKKLIDLAGEEEEEEHGDFIP